MPNAIDTGGGFSTMTPGATAQQPDPSMVRSGGYASRFQPADMQAAQQPVFQEKVTHSSDASASTPAPTYSLPAPTGGTVTRLNPTMRMVPVAVPTAPPATTPPATTPRTGNTTGADPGVIPRPQPTWSRRTTTTEGGSQPQPQPPQSTRPSVQDIAKEMKAATNQATATAALAPAAPAQPAWLMPALIVGGVAVVGLLGMFIYTLGSLGETDPDFEALDEEVEDLEVEDEDLETPGPDDEDEGDA